MQNGDYADARQSDMFVNSTTTAYNSRGDSRGPLVYDDTQHINTVHSRDSVLLESVPSF